MILNNNVNSAIVVFKTNNNFIKQKNKQIELKTLQFLLILYTYYNNLYVKLYIKINGYFKTK